MGSVSTLPQTAQITALLNEPTYAVAAALRGGSPSLAGMTLTEDVVEQIELMLLVCTGQPEWRLEHFRDSRPFGEMLEVSRMILDQRRGPFFAA